MVQTVKNLPAIQETGFNPWVEVTLEKEMTTHSSILAMDRRAWWATVHGATKSQTRQSDFHLLLQLEWNIGSLCI